MTEDKTIIISDLHLGSNLCQAKLLSNFLTDIETRCSRLILNGDIFDSIDFRRLKKSHWDILSLIRKVSNKIEVVWVQGNHDGDIDSISHLLGVQVVDQYSFSSGTRSILALHGHQFDSFLTDHPFLTWLGDLIYNFVQKLDRHHCIARFLKRNSKHYLRNALKVRLGSTNLGSKLDHDIVCAGHIHSKDYHYGTHPEYFNSGSWTELPCSYIEIFNGLAEVKEYNVAQ